MLLVLPAQGKFVLQQVTWLPFIAGTPAFFYPIRSQYSRNLQQTIFVVRQDWMLMVKRATSLFNSFWRNVVKQVTRSCCPCFWFQSILYSERCAHICLAPSQNSNVWRPNIFMFEPTLNLFSCYVSTSRLDLNDASQLARGCAWMSSEETVVVFVQCFYTDVAKTSISNFPRVGTVYSGELPQARTVLLFGSYSGQIFPRRNLLTRRRK